MSTTVSSQTPYVGSTLPVAPGQPGIDADVAAPTTRAGITAGTTPTAYDQEAAPASSGSYVVPSTPTAIAPTATDWKRLGATDEDLQYLRASGMSADELRSVYDSMYAEATMATSAGVTGADPLAGTPLENTGLLYDAQSGLAIDPQTNAIYDPATGSQLDPTTGQPMASGAEGATAAPGADDTAPGWSDEYATKYTEVMTAAGMSPEGADIMVQQLAADTTLNAAELDAGLEFYGSPEGAAQLKEIDAQVHAGVPLSAYLPLIGMGVGAATVVGGAGVAAYKVGDRAIQGRATSLMDRVAAGDAKATSRIAKPGMFDPAASRAAAMTGNGAKTATMTDRARASLQLLYERDAKLNPNPKIDVSTKPGSSVSGFVDDILKNGVDAQGKPAGHLAALAKAKGLTMLPGETVDSFAVRVAEKHGVHMKAPAAANFLSGTETKAHFNGGGGTAFRPAQHLGEGAKYRTAADRFGSVAHPVERLKLVTDARMAGPAMSAKAGGAGFLGRTGAEIAARSTGSTATLAGGLKGIGMQSLKATGSKLGVAGLVIGAGFEVPKVISTVKEHGIDSKESANAIGGATGRVVGAGVGFAAGAMSGAAIGAAVGTFIPVPIVGTLVGGAIGLGIGAGVSYFASKGLGGIGEHTGDALSAADKFGDKVLGETTMDVAQNVTKTAVKAVTNPVGAVKDAAEGVKDLGGKAVDKFKGLFD